MKNTNKSNKFKILFIIEAVLILTGIVTTTYSFITVGMLNTITPLVFLLLTYVSLIIHAVWGFKKTSLFYNSAAILALISEVIHNERIIERRAEFIHPIFYVAFLTAVFTFIFILTFRKFEKVANVFGALMVISAVIFPLIGMIISNVSPSEYFAALPFSSFATCSALYITFLVREQWKKDGRPDILFM